MIRFYDMATGELLHHEGKKAAATSTPERQQSGVLCPSVGLQEVSTEAPRPESGKLPPELATIEVEAFIEKQK
ncbi:MAG: hypothetical protein B0D96_13025 [Candidatus Sedimenticola endophacoides]|uniref:Uncharacterized protein n=1 Tax=Candidatus Sedimenticola endophacoides TaxID=2548426 RepID=A0A6N4DQ30_9GAMM|nr:MAG: hypothetical protein B0D94_07050 [Candidatus Sedimenticola endophacoides]OQX32780.1 MAG: hypothetical protein B0D96_13025 [Candidatus Sedimenticola endophacoides]OQX42744.1 MAG: hypothetical protein B0D89_00625 [Candidatus Sedimenticola endophacoides]OQX49364.1 MAG: hypothetical protein B0D87_00755 [Candidatus Sedimenticola endophacoides]PUD99473.1 MAG: hypothetical protein C3L26_08765 [Candidatus Sedimenticola endophacoides]